MASSSFTAFLLLFVTISSAFLQIHARESQFFSKMANKPADTVVLPDKQQEQQQQQEEQPEFVQQNQNGYGLYGHETGLYPPATETKSGVQTQTPGTYSSEKYFNNDRVDGARTEQFQNSNGETFYTNNGEKYTPSIDSDDDDMLNFDNKYTPSSGDAQKDDLLNFDDNFDNNGETETFYTSNHNGVGTERYTQTQKDNNFGSNYNNGETETFYTNNHNGVGTERSTQTQKDNNFGSNYNNGETETFYTNNHNGVGTERYTPTPTGNNFGSNYYKTDSDQDTNGETETFYRNNHAVGTARYTQTQKGNNLGTNFYQTDSNYDGNGQFGSQMSQAETDNNYYNDKRFDNGFTNELNARYAAYRAQFQNRAGESKAEKQGMSDTRFLENGRYFYDLNQEKTQNQYATQNTYNPNYNYRTDKVDETGNNFYDNSGGEKYEFNTMEEYERSRQNQYDP